MQKDGVETSACTSESGNPVMQPASESVSKIPDPAFPTQPPSSSPASEG